MAQNNKKSKWIKKELELYPPEEEIYYEDQAGIRTLPAQIEVVEWRKRYERMYSLYSRMINSRSWKITKPLRILKYILQGFESGEGKYIHNNNVGVHNDEKAGSIEVKRPETNTNYREYDYESNQSFKGCNTDIKALALYLPAFHRIDENDRWWGSGFTEWDNVKKAYPRYDGHNMPRVPHADCGYYDLTNVETIKKQAQLAKEHGVYGFAIYYYWFSGKRLLEQPLDILLSHKEIHIPFLLIWANENWTRAWDGREKEVLIKQEYQEEDPLNLIESLKKYVNDERYIRVNNKPVIGIYAIDEIPKPKEFVLKMREAAKKIGIGEIAIWVCLGDMTAEDLNNIDYVDGLYEFPPRGKGECNSIRRNDGGLSFDYSSLVELERHWKVESKLPVYRGLMMEWDNSGRKVNYHNWIHFSERAFYDWCCAAFEDTRRRHSEENRFVFINAWNEWGEGTYLEPDKSRGYASINTLSRALFGIPNSQNSKEKYYRMILGNNEICSSMGNGFTLKQKTSESRIAIQIHVYYDELIEEMIRYTNNMPYAFDLFLSTNSSEKAETILSYATKHSNAQNIFIRVFNNKGRDVMPFLLQMQPVFHKYEYICHLHTKKSLHMHGGDVWREYLLENLFGSERTIHEIFSLFERDEQLGLIYPENIDIIRSSVDWGSDKTIVRDLLKRMRMNDCLPRMPIFPAGDMFWAKTEAIKPVLQLNLNESDFPEEKGQIDGTIMHAIERVWCIVLEEKGYKYCAVRSVLDNRAL